MNPYDPANRAQKPSANLASSVIIGDDLHGYYLQIEGFCRPWGWPWGSGEEQPRNT